MLGPISVNLLVPVLMMLKFPLIPPEKLNVAVPAVVLVNVVVPLMVIGALTL